MAGAARDVRRFLEGGFEAWSIAFGGVEIDKRASEELVALQLDDTEKPFLRPLTYYLLFLRSVSMTVPNSPLP